MRHVPLLRGLDFLSNTRQTGSVQIGSSPVIATSLHAVCVFRRSFGQFYLDCVLFGMCQKGNEVDRELSLRS